MSGGRRLVLAALAAAFVCRLAFAFGYWQDKPLTRDEREYLDLAQQAARGQGLRYGEGGADRFARAPLYPLFVAAVLRLAGDERRELDATPGSLKLAQSALGAAAVWLIALLTARAAGDRAGATAAWLAAVYPPLGWISAYVFSETLYVVLALAAVLLLDRGFEAAGGSERGAAARSIVVTGALCGLAALTRPAHLVFVACACAWLARRRRIALAAALAAAAMVVIVPWTVRNHRENGRVTLIAAEGGVTFWTGNHPLARGEGDMAANPQLKLADLEFRRAHPGLSAEQLEPLYYRAALAWIREQPLDWAALVRRKLFYVLVPVGPSYRLHSTRYFVASIVSYGILLPLGVAGAWRLRRGPRPPRALGLFAASGVLTALIFMPQERFRISTLDPPLLVCAAALAARENDAGRRFRRAEGST